MRSNKILVISDTHLSKHFDPDKFELLKKLILESDKVIINGDFWDSWLTDFNVFLESKWSMLFPYLLDKKAVYIFGNHDPRPKNDERTNRFSVFNGDSFMMDSGGSLFRFEHGHKILNSQNHIGMRTYSNIINFSEERNLKVILKLLDGLKICGFVLLGPKIMCNSTFSRKRNRLLKNHAKKTWLICGDTHCPEIDNFNKFANSGCIINGFCSYLIIEDGKVRLEKI